MPRLNAGGLQVYYERHGAGAPVLFISGSGGDLRNKPNQFDSPLGGAFDLISYDQRGLGQTQRPPGPYSMAQYADDAAALLDALDIETLPVIGVSFGGMVAQEFALRHPNRVSVLVLACTSSGGQGGASYPLHELADLAPRPRAEAHLKVSDRRHTPAWIQAHPEQWERRVQLAMSATRPDRDETGAALQLEARRHHDTYDRLPNLSMPVLLAGGEFDGIAPPENMQALAGRIPDAQLNMFAGGHLFLVQDKSAYPLIIQWVKRKVSLKF